MFSRLASFTARPKRTLGLLVVFVLLAGAVGGPVAGALKDSGGFTPGDSDSQTATDLLEHASGRQAAPGIVLLADTPRAGAARARLARAPGIAAAAIAARSRDGRHALVTGTLAAGADRGRVVADLHRAFDGDRGVTVGGAAVAGEEIGSTVSEDLGRAELLAFPVLVLLSLLIFRGRAAVLPLATGVTAVLGTFLVLRGVNAVYGLSVFALNLVIGLGLGLAIDYSLLLVTRFREELDADAAPREAIGATLATAGRTIAFSAATVAAALGTLTLFPQSFLKSMGIAGAVVAVVAALAALVVTPSLLALWGRRLALPAARRHAATDGRWYRLAHAVMRRPGVVAAVTAAAMLALAAPALTTVWSPVDASAVPQGESARTVSDAMARDFAGAGQTPLTVAIAAPRTDRASVAAYARDVARVDGVRAVRRPLSLGHAVWQLDASVRGSSSGPAAQRAVERVRDLRPPFTAHVTGPAAEFVDQQQAIGSHLAGAIALLAGLTVVLLWLMTGSVVLPLKAIAMNALTVGAALAPLVLIYQHGHLTGLLGYTSNGGVEPSDFVVTAALVFALSTDYGVFLLGRIKEARDGGLGEREAVATGLGRTGRVITAAAILLAVAIGAFSTSSISFIQQIGVATATGVLVDAFVVRSLLVPSLMALLGRWNWWSPRPLRRLHERIGLRESPAARPRSGITLRRA